jgi:putative ABC transport system permease protein
VTFIPLRDAARDAVYGVRMCRRAPAFAIVVVLTLGLGIGAATAVFSVVHGVLLRDLPYQQPDRIVRLFQVDSSGRRNATVSEPNFEDWRDGTVSYRALAQVSAGPVPVAVGSDVTMISGAGVSRAFFDVMGVQPGIGRRFVDEELVMGGRRAVIVSDRFWRTRLGAAPLDQLTIRISGQIHQVVGIMPPGFAYPAESEFWTPRELDPPQTSRTAHNFTIVGRLEDGVTIEAAQGELSRVSRALKERYGDDTWMSDAAVVPLRDQLTATARPVLLVLFAAALLLLGIACLNVSNLQLARAATRRRELAVRLAVGAGRGRLVRQLLAEGLVLSGLAAVVGSLLAVWGVQALVALQPGNLPRIDEVRVDWPVLAFAVGTALVTTMLVGILTALRAANGEVSETLSEGARTMAGGRSTERVRQALVVAQVALTIVLLAGAGLLARSFVELVALDPGYRTDRVLLLDSSWSFSSDAAVRQRRRDAQRDMLARARAVPHVDDVGLINAFPLSARNAANGQFLELTRPDEIQSFEDFAALGDEAKTRAGFAGYRVASAGYFTTMGIRLIRGRLFEDGDGPDAPHVALISESLAATKWPNEDPLGRYVQFGNMDGDLRAFRIVGIVSDVREAPLESPSEPLFYGHYRQRMATTFSIVVGTDAADAVAAGLRRTLLDIDPDLPIQVWTVEHVLDRALAGRRFSLIMIGVFSAAALILAMLGIYGLIAYLVAERTREIGIRLALGATSTDVLRLVLAKGVTLAAGGLVVGLAAALAMTRFIQGMLYGVSATDPMAFGAVILATLAAVLVASYVPARRAVMVLPVVALKRE